MITISLTTTSSTLVLTVGSRTTPDCDSSQSGSPGCTHLLAYDSISSSRSRPLRIALIVFDRLAADRGKMTRKPECIAKMYEKASRQAR